GAAGIRSTPLLVLSKGDPLRWAPLWPASGGPLFANSVPLRPPGRRASAPLRCSSSPKATRCAGLPFGSASGGSLSQTPFRFARRGGGHPLYKLRSAVFYCPPGELEGAEPASNGIECPAVRRHAKRGLSACGGKYRHF